MVPAALLSVLESSLLQKMIDSHVPLVGRSVIEKIALLLCGIMLVLGLGFMVFAFYLYVQTVQSPVMAAVLAGAFSLMIAAVIAGVQLSIIYLKIRKIKMIKAELLSVLRVGGESVQKDVEGHIQDHPLSSVVLAALAGYMVGDRFI